MQSSALCSKWGYLLDEMEKQEQWENTFKACFRSVTDNTVIWLQYKILYNCLSTRDYLYKINLKDNNLCIFSYWSPEAIVHLFCECEKVQQLWYNVEKKWILMKVGVHLNFPNGLKFLGYRKMDSNFWPINFLILMTKRYIYKCAYKELICTSYIV